MEADAVPFGVGGPAEATHQSGAPGLLSGLYNAFGGMAKAAMGNSQTALDTGNYNPKPALEAAMLPMGTGAFAGVPLRGGEVAFGAGPIRAYHGSPHDFDKFDLKKIGTGEGAQAYGHGLYFAEKEGTARAYRDQLSGRPVNLADIDSPNFRQSLSDAIANNSVQLAGRDIEQAKKSLQSQINEYPNGSYARQDYEAALEMLHMNPHKYAGRMYEVNINADPKHFLDWDKPLSQQPAVHQKLLDAYRNPASERRRQQNWEQPGWSRNPGDPVNPSFAEKIKGGTEYQALAGNLGKWDAASKALQERGIPGIKYLDQGSRGAGAGSSNYVVFDDKLIDIMRKYGIALPAGAVAASQLQGQDGT